MSGGGGGPIIIRNLIDNPDTTATEKDICRGIEERTRINGGCSIMDAIRSAFIVYRILRR